MHLGYRAELLITSACFSTGILMSRQRVELYLVEWKLEFTNLLDFMSWIIQYFKHQIYYSYSITQVILGFWNYSIRTKLSRHGVLQNFVEIWCRQVNIKMAGVCTLQGFLTGHPNQDYNVWLRHRCSVVTVWLHEIQTTVIFRPSQYIVSSVRNTLPSNLVWTKFDFIN